MKNKRGAASFYIVAFSTLILVVIATSFAMVIMSEMTRTMHDDLSQSAYDSALAGVEDAKVAFSNYQRCAEANFPDGECKRIQGIMEHPECDMVKRMLYTDKKYNERIDNGEQTLGGIVTTSVSKTTTTNQAYTCVKILTELADYRSSLGTKTGKYVQTIRAGVEDGGTNTVNKIRFSWYLKKNNNPIAYNNITDSGVVGFGTAASIPPTIEMQIVQTGSSFNLSDFDSTDRGTDRATLYFVPSSKEDSAKNLNGSNYIGVYNGAINTISSERVIKTNDRYVSNKPFMVYCNDRGEFYCSVEINLPAPVRGESRANNTFLISVSIPYRDPDTDFSLELVCSDGGGCGGEMASGSSDAVKLKNIQVAIDSTGRANDLYRRVETRLEASDTEFGVGKQSPYYALQILGDDGIKKDMTVTDEHTDDFKF